MTTETATKTKLVRVVHRAFYDAVHETTYYLRVPEGMTDKDVESFDGYREGIVAGETDTTTGIVCVGSVDGGEQQIIESLDATGGWDIESIREISEEDMQEELG
jgi:hypothetical protein